LLRPRPFGGMSNRPQGGHGKARAKKSFEQLHQHGSFRELKIPSPRSTFRPVRLAHMRNFEILPGATQVFGMVISAAALACLLPATAGAKQAGAGTPTVVQPGAPGMPTKTLPLSTRPTVPPVAQADVDFMQGMIMHHSQAVEMTALIASHTENQAVRSLGAKISSSQSDEIRFMQRWLVARRESVPMAMTGMTGMDMSGRTMAPMPGMLTPQQMEELRNAKGAEFDHLFLTGMIQHHNGALIMVKDLFDAPGAGQDADLFNFATDADNTQRAEIKIMQHMLEEKR
jgi:uncharacterized protein (DUF305 family)